MFTESYASAMHWLTAASRPWLGEADIYTGHHPAQLWLSSLGAFWPGLQVRSCCDFVTPQAQLLVCSSSPSRCHAERVSCKLGTTLHSSGCPPWAPSGQARRCASSLLWLDHVSGPASAV